MTKAPARRPDVSAYAWLVFALTFGLLISDYMARQVLSAVFPLLKAEWHLTRRPARVSCPASLP